MQKYFVLDTNVLLHDATSLFAFGDNVVVVPIEVLEELDKFKAQNDELGRNAREVVRALDTLRAKGSLADGIALNGGGGGRLMVDLTPSLPVGHGLARDTPDNRILSTAWKLKTEGKPVIFVSKDLNLRIKSDAYGITTQDFEKEKVRLDRLFTGWRDVLVTPEALERFERDGALEIEHELYPNEYALLRGPESRRTLLARRTAESTRLVRAVPKLDAVYGVLPRNLEQTIALHLLLDDSIPLVTLVGKAGTGKTLLALAAGLQKTVKESIYEKILVSRPIMPLGRDIGYLPGTKDEKLAHWMKPIFDNLTFLLRDRHHMGGDSQKRAQDLLRTGIVEMEPLTYIRGRSIYNQYLIVDEAQNLTPHEVKTIISRAGDVTKLVLTGDPNQIDNPYLDAASNGLTYTAHAMRDQSVSGHCLLTRSERSKLASVAADVL